MAPGLIKFPVMTIEIGSVRHSVGGGAPVTSLPARLPAPGWGPRAPTRRRPTAGTHLSLSRPSRHFRPAPGTSAPAEAPCRARTSAPALSP